MSTLQQHIALIANLIAQLRELDRLREQVRKAELRHRGPDHCLHGGSNLKPLRNLSENLRSATAILFDRKFRNLTGL
jgi:hypothetical protein